MRDTRSLRVFNENYPLSRSFSLRVVGVTPPLPPCEGVTPSRSLWGYYTPTPLRGYYTLALPCYLFIAHSNARFVKGSRRKIFRGNACKNFRALDNDGKQHNKHTRGAVPAPRLSCFITRRSSLRRTILPADTRRGTAFKQLGTGQKCQIFKQFCPVPNCLIWL